MPATAMPVLQSQETVEPKKMTLDEFLAWDQDELGTGEKFEWVDGVLELAGEWMKADERHLVLNLEQRYSKTSAFKMKSRMIPETSCVLSSKKTRIPDLAFFDHKQIKQSSAGEHPVPRWVIEIISPSDRAIAIEEKVKEYFDSGVELVWQIFAGLEHIRIFTGVDQVTQFSGDAVCSAKPVLDDFEIAVSEVFREW